MFSIGKESGRRHGFFIAFVEWKIRPSYLIIACNVHCIPRMSFSVLYVTYMYIECSEITI